MKTHNINDAQLQAAIDEACQEVANGPHRPICAELSLKDVNTSDWSNESLARLDLAKAFLARLPEPTPPVVDGKTPSINDLQDIYFANASMGYAELPHDHAEALQAVADAVAQAAIARMDAVPCEELEKAYWNGQGAVGSVTACERIRARLIAAARGQGEAVSQPAEIPWIEWHGGECPLNDEEVEEWEYKFRNGISKKANNTPSMYAWYHTPHDDHDDIVAYRVLKWREANQPAEQADPYADLKAAHAEGKIIQWRFKGATAWMTKTSNFDQYPDQCEYRIKPEPATFEAHGHTWTKASHRPQNATAPVYWLLESELSGARDYAPDFISTSENLGDWEGIVGWRYANEPTPAPVPAWQPAVGDVVTIKSGGPKMTVNLIITDKFQCVWFVGDEAKYITVSPATLQPA